MTDPAVQPPNNETIMATETSSTMVTKTNGKSTSNGGDGSCVQVAVRIRPMLPFESGSTQCVEALSSNASTGELTVVRLGGESGPKFTFDEVFPIASSQVDVYADRVLPLVDNCLEGYNATILAYGQTGSGKTFTIMGPSLSNVADAVQDEVHAGVIPRAIRSIFEKLENNQQSSMQRSGQQHKTVGGNESDSCDAGSETDSSTPSSCSFQYEVRVQFLEVYGEDIRDLLNPHKPTAKLTIRDVGMDEPEVLGATQHKVESAEDALLCLTRGMFRRVTGSTNMNASSSRSHAILSLVVEQSVVIDDESEAQNKALPPGNNHGNIHTSTNRNPNGNGKIRQHVQAKVSKFNFVDLAGSERQKRTGAEGLRLKEGIDINKGLLVLGNVISALGDPKKKGKTFVPYRDSKLTRLLKGSLGGNHKTLMIACVSPSSNNMEESLNCLRYANRAKNIQNHAVVNVDASSRLIADLRGKVQALASDLLRATEVYGQLQDQLQGGAKMDSTTAVFSSTFSVDTLMSLASGREGNFPSTPLLTSKALPNQVTPNFISPIQQPDLSSSPSRLHRVTSNQRGDGDDENKIHALTAEREALRLQLEALKSALTADDAADRTNSSCVATAGNAERQAFIARSTDYEREIADLKKALLSPTSDGMPSSRSDHDRSSASGNYRDDRPYLPNLPPRTPGHRGRSGSGSHPERAESPELSRLRAQVFGSMSQSNHLDAEVEAEERAREELTKRYLEHHDDDNIAPNTLNDDPHHIAKTLSSSDKYNRTNDAVELFSPEGETSVLEFGGRSHQQLEADLFELSNSIFAKEELIHQLQSSQEKYEAMREFYESKLRGMAELLRQKEAESEKVAQELKELGAGHIDSHGLAEQLRQKQESIAELKKKQRELSRLTSVASQNEKQLAKLRKEVVEMKERKVTLQKQLKEERKSHMIEVKKLKKEVMQKDREIVKIKRVSDKKSFEAQRAQQMAKTRVEQISQLRAKYRETEKRLRMHTVKRGVMEKAGLDPVMVGHREKGKVIKSSSTADNSTVNFDAIRDFFDHKVADVGRREALAEKIAQEWEEHFELTIKRDELQRSDLEGMREECKSVDCQVKYKEERIRQLAARLGKRKSDTTDTSTSEKDTFLFDKTFKSVVGRVSPLAASKSAAIALFGMVVRERRRIASLARTASSLDEKVQEAEAAAAAKDSAFRAYVDEQRHEMAMLTQNQQEQILSLMDMVRDENANSGGASEFQNGDSNGTVAQPVDGHANPKLLVLANERISVLERQLRDMQSRSETLQQHMEREEEAISQLQQKTKECEDLEEEISRLQRALRQIREVTPTNGYETGTVAGLCQMPPAQEILEVVTKALHPTEGWAANKIKRRRSNSISSISHAHTPTKSEAGASTNTSDSEFVPDWAGDIMADIATIAEGKMPSSLKDSALVKEAGGPSAHKNNVFDRLAAPTSFTGVQKQRQTRSKAQKKVRSSSTPPHSGQRQRKLISKQVADSLEKLVVPDEPLQKKTPSRSGPNESASRRSVFDRLVSPSNLTGTQKRKFHDKEKRGSGSCSGEEKKAYDDHSTHEMDQSSDSSIRRDAEDMLDDLLCGGNDGSRSAELSQAEGVAVSGKKLDDYTQQNVFERLQKTTTQAYAVKQHSNIAEKMLGDLLDSESKEEHPKGDSIEKGQQNVFERLQKTTTQAYAVKQQTNIAEKILGDILDTEDSTSLGEQKTEHGGSGFERVDGYVQQNVFERLQKTTTQSYAGKQSTNIADKLLDDILDPDKEQGKKILFHSEQEGGRDTTHRTIAAPTSPSRNRGGGTQNEPKDQYVRQNVFERLQKTNTESYAKKKNPPLEYHPQHTGHTNEPNLSASASSLPRNDAGSGLNGE